MITGTESFLGSIFSGTRNSIITTTLGIGIYGFSRTFKKNKAKTIMKLISQFLYIFAFINLLNVTLMLRTFRLSLLNEDKSKLNKTFLPKYWKRSEYINWFLLVIISILIVLSSSRFFSFVKQILFKKKNKW